MLATYKMRCILKGYFYVVRIMFVYSYSMTLHDDQTNDLFMPSLWVVKYCDNEYGQCVLSILQNKCIYVYVYTNVQVTQVFIIIFFKISYLQFTLSRLVVGGIYSPIHPDVLWSRSARDLSINPTYIFQKKKNCIENV